MMKPTNLVVIMSDEHNPSFMGHRGHPLVKTPHLDGLAARGTAFTSAYCNSPICVPSRASFATGQYTHQCGFWDNAHPYDGSIPSWGHRLQAAGHHVASIGKLHYRSAEDNNGFDEEIEPMHVVGGVGDLMGLLRDDMVERPGAQKLSQHVGRGETSYTAYDRKVAAEAASWLSKAPTSPHKPWVLFVSFVTPHFPLVAPEPFYDLYAGAQIDLPPLYAEKDRPQHPYYQAMRRNIAYDAYFDPERRDKAIRAYLGLVSFMDANVGKVLDALEEAGLSETTRVIYTSDHGEALGKRGFWGKSTMFEESVAVPMIMAGPDIAVGKRVTTPVSLIDLHPTILRTTGVSGHASDANLPGRDLCEIAAGVDKDRAVFSEYHAAGSIAACFMLRKGDLKLVHFEGFDPELYDLSSDPDETRNLAKDPSYASGLASLKAELVQIVDTAEVDARARAQQAQTIAAHGGRAAILKRGDFGYSPPPGAQAHFASDPEEAHQSS